MCSPPILIFLNLSFTHPPRGSLSSSHLSPPFIPPPPTQRMAARLPPPAHSARRPSPFIPSPPSHSPSPPLSPPLPSLPSGGEIHARPAGRRGSSTAGRAWELGAGHPRAGARPRPSQELDYGRRRSSARPRPRRPAHGPFPADPSPSLFAPFPC